MKLGLIVTVFLTVVGCSSGNGSGPTTTASGGGSSGGSGSGSGGGGSGSSSGGTSAGSDAAAPGDSDSGGASFDTAPWVGTWSCTSSGSLDGSALPNSASTAEIHAAGPGRITVVATTTGSSNPPCTLTATLTSDTAAAFPPGQSCDLVTPVSATLTLTNDSTATLQGAHVTTSENVSVSNSPGFDGQTGTLTGTCAKQ